MPQKGTDSTAGNVGIGKEGVGYNANLLTPDIALPSFSTMEGVKAESRDTPEGVGSQRKGNLGTGKEGVG